MYFWTRKSPLNFISRPVPNADSGPGLQSSVRMQCQNWVKHLMSAVKTYWNIIMHIAQFTLAPLYPLWFAEVAVRVFHAAGRRTQVVRVRATAMYDASKYVDHRTSLSSDNGSTVAREVSPAGLSVDSEHHFWHHRARPLPVSSSVPNGLVVDQALSPSAAGHDVVRNGGRSRKTVNGLSSSSDSSRHLYVGPRLDVPAALTASLDEATLRSPDSVASTLSSPADVQPSGDLFSTTIASGRYRFVSLANEYFPVTLGGRRSTDPGQVPVTSSTSNGHHHHRRHHSHHRRHRQQAQRHGRPSSGHSSSSSNSRSSVSHIYPAATASNGTVVNGTCWW